MDEIKRITLSFSDKAALVSSSDTIQYALEDIEKIFEECNEELSKAGMSECSYGFQEAAIHGMTEGLETLLQYVYDAHPHVSGILDNPLYVDFKNNASESLSRIILDEITTDNTFGMEEHVQINGHGFSCITRRVKKELKFSDFFGITDIEPEDGYPVLENVETMGEFATLFRTDYDKMKPEGVSLDTFLKEYLAYGEYDHKAYHPVADFFSGLLDITIIKPVIECITGTDLITGEKLTDAEMTMKLAGAVVDVFTLGQALVLTKGAGLGLRTAGKVVVVELLSNAAAYTAGYAGNAMGLPLPATWLLSVITGCSVSYAAGKYIYKDADGLAHELTGEEAGRLVKEQKDALKEIPGLKGDEVPVGGGGLNSNLLDELANSGVKYNPEDIVAITKTADGKLVWLENGTDTAGLNHIITEHADDFLNKGITQEQIPDYVMNALENGKIVGYQGRGTGRPIYEFTYNGEIHKVAITVGNNGFIVGANPK